MAGLSDMEELIGKVDDKEVASFLTEALTCYGTGAHRACVVLTHIALFDSLRRKIKALSPVNKIAKSVSDEIEILNSNQKVFETPIIHKLKSSGIITQLEAQILEQLNNQRNKAAHPSGHNVTAEEARFVFSEAIKKFISQPIRETSYVVDEVISKLSDRNFFPSTVITDMISVITQELINLDPAARPLLINKINDSIDSTDGVIVKNAKNFMLALSSRKDKIDRLVIIKVFIDKRCSNETFSELIFTVITGDPEILNNINSIIKLRVKKLIMKHANDIGVSGPYFQFRQPTRLLGECVKVLGEDFVLSELRDFSDWVINKTPYSSELLNIFAKSPILFSRLFEKYIAQAKSSQWATSNPFAAAVPSLDAPLSDLTTDEQAFTLLAAIMRGAEWSGNGPLALANTSFNSLPLLKAKAQRYAIIDPDKAAEIIEKQGVDMDYSDFIKDRLS